MLKVGCKARARRIPLHTSWRSLLQLERPLVHAPRRSLVGHKGSAKGLKAECGIWAFRYRELTRQMSSYSSSLLFVAAMAERDSERTGLLSQGSRGTLERSRDGAYARFVF